MWLECIEKPNELPPIAQGGILIISFIILSLELACDRQTVHFLYLFPLLFVSPLLILEEIIRSKPMLCNCAWLVFIISQPVFWIRQMVDLVFLYKIKTNHCHCFPKRIKIFPYNFWQSNIYIMSTQNVVMNFPGTTIDFITDFVWHNTQTYMQGC